MNNYNSSEYVIPYYYIGMLFIIIVFFTNKLRIHFIDNILKSIISWKFIQYVICLYKSVKNKISEYLNYENKQTIITNYDKQKKQNKYDLLMYYILQRDFNNKSHIMLPFGIPYNYF